MPEDGEDDPDPKSETNGVSPRPQTFTARRRRRRSRQRSVTLRRLSAEVVRRDWDDVGKMTSRELALRPVTRGDCTGPRADQELRPCPWVGCRFHLYLDINPDTGSIKINFPDLEPWELTHTCALDIAERGGITLDEVGEIMNLTRERIRQLEVRGLIKMKMSSPSGEETDLGASAAELPLPKRRR